MRTSERQTQFTSRIRIRFNTIIRRAGIGQATGLRLSFISQRTYSLVWAENYNQSYYSTDFYIQQPLSQPSVSQLGSDKHA